jgi:hypothetical protein
MQPLESKAFFDLAIGMAGETQHDWAVEEFGAARLGDARWRARLIAMGAEVARRPGGKVSKVFNSAATRQGAYGLLERAEIGAAEIVAAMVAAAGRRCASLPFVYVPVDGSSVTITDKARTKGFGNVGDHVHGARGLKVISALLVSPLGVPLGLGAQIWWARQREAAKKSRERRRTEEKETQHWLEAMQQAREVIDAEAPQTRLWFQLDREGDAWPIITDAGKGGHWFTIRGTHNRRVRLPDGSQTYLRTVLGLQPVACTYTLSVSAGPNRSARLARMVVRGCEATLDFRDKRTKKHFPKTVNVVLAREDGTTPAGERPVEWLLLSNRPITTVEALTQVVLGYAQRWRIEEFHRTWKSGACDVEDMQLRSMAAAQKWATILAAVAVRIERLKLLSRKEPERPASDEFTPGELKAIAALRFGEQARTKLPEVQGSTIKEAVHWVAEIGGYTGKSSGGPPGSITISRGLQEVLTVARALAAMDAKCD